MAQKRSKPGPLTTAVTGSGIVLASSACNPEHRSPLSTFQVPNGAIRLAARFGLSVSTAQAVAEANLWGAP